MIAQLKSICMIVLMGHLMLGLQSGKRYERICRTMLEFLTVIYVVGMILGCIGGEKLTIAVLGDKIVSTGLFTSEMDGVASGIYGEGLKNEVKIIEKSIVDMNQELCKEIEEKVKSEINNNESREWGRVETRTNQEENETANIAKMPKVKPIEIHIPTITLAENENDTRVKKNKVNDETNREKGSSYVTNTMDD